MTDQWVDIKDARTYLGRGWGRDSIKLRIQDNELSEGIHFRDDRRKNSAYGNYKINLTAIERDFRVPIIERSA